MSKSRFPDALVLIFGMIVVALVATWLLPAGAFERDGRAVIPGTYARVEADALPVWAFLTSIPTGMMEAGDIIFFVFIVGGVIGIVRATGAIDAMIGSAIASGFVTQSARRTGTDWPSTIQPKLPIEKFGTSSGSDVTSELFV